MREFIVFGNLFSLSEASIFKLLRLVSVHIFISGLRDIWISVPLLHSQRKQTFLFDFLIVMIEMLSALPATDCCSASLSQVVLIGV